MIETVEGDQRPDRILERGTLYEMVTFRVVEAHMANYPNAQQACLDLIDNGIDDRIRGELLYINVSISKDEIVITNRGGKGLGLPGLERFFRWGESDKEDWQIGEYGVGGKGAMGYLGRSIEVTCSEPGSDVEYHVVDTDWKTKLGEDRIPHEWLKRPATSSEGYFRARVWNLNRNVNPKALEAKLGDIYRPLLIPDPIDGTNRAVKITVGRNEVKPLEIKYVLDDSELQPTYSPIGTPFGEEKKIRLFVGVLAPGERIKPGIRCYHGGRLIHDGEFFGFPTPERMRQSQRLIGEAYLDYVPVTPNKSDFILDSIEWQEAFLRITDVLMEEWKLKLETLPIEQVVRIEGFEKRLTSDVRRALDHIIHKGRLMERIEQATIEESEEQERIKRPSGKRTGRGSIDKTTQQKKESAESYKYLTEVPPIEIASMGSLGRESQLVSLMQGREVLRINADYPLYQDAKLEGDAALRRYMDMVSATELASVSTQGQSPQDFRELLTSLWRDIGEYRLGSNIRTLERQRTRGSIRSKSPI